MIWVGLPVLGVFALLVWIAEFQFFHSRVWVPAGRKIRIIRMSLFVILGLLVAFQPYQGAEHWGTWIFAVLALISLFLVSFEAGWDEKASVRKTAAEAGIQVWSQFFHPLALLILAAIWPFINGVSFLVGWVMPFGVEGLKPLSFGFALVMACLVIFQMTRRSKPSHSLQPPVGTG